MKEGDKGTAHSIEPLRSSAIAAPVPRSTARGLHRQALILKHSVSAWLRSPGTIGKMITASISLGLVVYPLLRTGWRFGVAYSVFWLFVAANKAWRELSPKNMQLVQTNYLERKYRLHKLISQLHKWQTLSPGEIRNFQEEALQLIASYVRGHRLDAKGTKIFTNLLIADGEDMVVIVRDRPHRDHSVKHQKSTSIAWLAMVTGEAQVTGDIYADFPDTPKGKPYKSIIAIPVKFERTIVGAVTIDSSQKYHFDRDFKNLVEYVNPYVTLLAWTLQVPTSEPLVKILEPMGSVLPPRGVNKKRRSGRKGK